MKKFLICLCALALMLSACGAPQTPDESKATEPSAEAATPSTEATVPPISAAGWNTADLGICSAENVSLPASGRNPWDLVITEGKLYVGTGDYGKNTGPTSIWCWDGKWTASRMVDQEAIARFVNLDGKTVALGVDPLGSLEYAESYVLQNGNWAVYNKIDNALHVFDAESYNGAVYFGLGSEDDVPNVVKYDTATHTYAGVSLYKNGVDYIASVSQNPALTGRRVYDLFQVDGKLYCTLVCMLTGKTTMEFFELTGDKFEWRQAFVNTGMQMNRVVGNQVMLNADAVYDGSCYLSTGNLYKTGDFVKFEQVTIPGNPCVTDLFTGTDGVLYILTARGKLGAYKNSIYTLSGGTLAEVLSFDSTMSALSFAKDSEGFYIGLGNAAGTNADTGRILKFTKG